MEIRTRYICDICKGEYLTQEMCQVCENFPNAPRPDIKVGDMVYVVSEEGQRQKCKVTHAPELVSDVFLQMQYHYHDEDMIEGQDLRDYKFGSLHMWIIRVDQAVLLDRGYNYIVPVYQYIEGYRRSR